MNLDSDLRAFTEVIMIISAGLPNHGKQVE